MMGKEDLMKEREEWDPKEETKWQRALVDVWSESTWYDWASAAHMHGHRIYGGINDASLITLEKELQKIPITHGTTADLVLEARIGRNSSSAIDFSLHGMVERGCLHGLVDNPVLDRLDIDDTSWALVRKWAHHQLAAIWHRRSDQVCTIADDNTSLCPPMPAEELLHYINDFWLEFDAYSGDGEEKIPQPSIFVGPGLSLQSMLSRGGFETLMFEDYMKDYDWLMKMDSCNECTNMISLMQLDKQSLENDLEKYIEKAKLSISIVGSVLNDLFNHLMEPLGSAGIRELMGKSLAALTVRLDREEGYQLYQFGLWLSRTSKSMSKIRAVISVPEIQNSDQPGLSTLSHLHRLGIDLTGKLGYSHADVAEMVDILGGIELIGLNDIALAIDVLSRSDSENINVCKHSDNGICTGRNDRKFTSTVEALRAVTNQYLDFGTRIGFEIKLKRGTWDTCFFFLSARGHVDLEKVNLQGHMKDVEMVNVLYKDAETIDARKNRLSAEVEKAVLSASKVQKSRERGGGSERYNISENKTLYTKKRREGIETSVESTINHIKVSFQPGGKVEVKLYTQGSVDHEELYPSEEDTNI
eukprot:g1169.t1